MKEAIYLNNDFRCPPFAWPQFSKRTPSGDQVITYPADLTHDLLRPFKRTLPKRKRASNRKSEVKKEEVDLDPIFQAEFQAAKARLLGEAAI